PRDGGVEVAAAAQTLPRGGQGILHGPLQQRPGGFTRLRAESRVRTTFACASSTVPREFSPCTFRGPPNDHASAKNENRQRKPCIEVSGNDTPSKHEHRCDHREIVRARVAAVGPSAPP